MILAPARIALGAALMTVCAPVQARTVDLTQIESESQALANGEYVTASLPQDAAVTAVSPVSIIINLPEQRAYVFRDGALIAATSVSTGKDGKETPTGSFTILQKKVMHKSNLYDDAPMPFMQRLTWDGIAIHAGKLPGYPASHGCIRMPAAFAKSLYGLTQVGAVVTVTDMAMTPAEMAVLSTGAVPNAAPDATATAYQEVAATTAE